MDGRILVVRRIHVTYRLRLDAGTDRAAVERVHGFHADNCPVARTLRGSVDISTDVVIEEAPAA